MPARLPAPTAVTTSRWVDMGYFDDDGYLFLTGRSAELIISGGVNIYPQEVDELLRHPAGLDVCRTGVPNVEFGEEVKSLVQLRRGHAPTDALKDELIAWVRDRLVHLRCPARSSFATIGLALGQDPAPPGARRGLASAGTELAPTAVHDVQFAVLSKGQRPDGTYEAGACRHSRAG
jgi:acyl-CoA synthetase (AMP-forming)/AMP-acid ligase II